MKFNLKKKIAIIILPLIVLGIATTVIFNKNVVESKLPLKICLGEFAFCGASSTKPTGNKMIVNGKEFYEGEAICPVMTGPSIANMELMNNSCDAPDGTDKTVWSLFWYYTEVPQSPTWEVSPTVNREFVTTNELGGGMSNMWSFPCNIIPKEVNGTKLSKCYGPINETVFPFRGSRKVTDGETSVTQAPEGSSYPVGAIIPVTDAELLTENQDEI
jgi:hypothetical protein